MAAPPVLTCEQCSKRFPFAQWDRPGSPPARWCSKRCRNRAGYLARRPNATDRRLRRRKPVPLTPAERRQRRLATHARYNLKRVRVPATSPEPMPMPYVGHAVFEQAREAARLSTDWASDWGQHDILGEAVLAILEGRSPDDAIRRHRAHEASIQRLTDRRIIDVGFDGRKVIAQYEEAA